MMPGRQKMKRGWKIFWGVFFATAVGICGIAEFVSLTNEGEGDTFSEFLIWLFGFGATQLGPFSYAWRIAGTMFILWFAYHLISGRKV